MTTAGPLSWKTGAGWVVLAGGGRDEADGWGPLDSAVLGWASPGRAVAAVVVAPAAAREAEAVLESWADLGSSTGYVVDLSDPSRADSTDRWGLLAEAGLIYLAGSISAARVVRALQESHALEAVEAAFLDGAPIVAASTAAEAMGAWVERGAGDPATVPGLGWLSGVVVATGFTGAESSVRLRAILREHPASLGIGVPDGGALALGPGGRIETFGPQQVTVVLGHQLVD